MEELDCESKVVSSFICEKCNYKTNKESNYYKHLLTNKHKQNKTVEEKLVLHICSCGNSYKHRQGLWKHKNLNNCNTNVSINNLNDTNNVTNNDLKNILEEILAILKHKNK
jgi:hypothetical protein